MVYFTEQKQQISLTLEKLKYTDNYVHLHYEFIINIFNDTITLDHNNYILNEIKKILPNTIMIMIIIIANTNNSVKPILINYQLIL